MKPEKSPYYIDYCLTCQEMGFILNYNDNLKRDIEDTQKVIDINQKSVEFLILKKEDLLKRHNKYLEENMTHKKIIKSCEKKLMKDAKHYHQEEKEAKKAVKGLKSALSKPKMGHKASRGR